MGIILMSKPFLRMTRQPQAAGCLRECMNSEKGNENPVLALSENLFCHSKCRKGKETTAWSGTLCE